MSLLLFVSISIPVYAQVPDIASVPQNLPASAALNKRHASLQKWHDQLKAKTVAHKSKCTGVTEGTQLNEWCREEQGRLEDEKAKYIAAVNKFNADVAAPGEDLRDAVGEPPLVEGGQVKKSQGKTVSGVTRGEIYKDQNDGCSKISFSNSGDDTVFVTVRYHGAGRGVCIKGHGSGEVTLHCGKSEADAPISFNVQHSSTCAGR